MSDPTAMLKQFKTFLDLIQGEGRNPSEEDINFFITEFLKRGRNGFIYKGEFIESAAKVDPTTQLRHYDVSGKSYDELVNEIKPILSARVVEAYGSVRDEYKPFDFDTQPMTVEERALFEAKNMGKEDEYLALQGTARRNHPAYERAIRETSRVKYRLKQYMKTVLPFTLRTNMHHRLAAILYSTTSGPFAEPRQKDDNGKDFKIDSEDELNAFLSSKTINGFPAAEHDAMRSLFWVPSESGRNLKMGVIDIDNPSNLNQKEMNSVVKKIYKRIHFDLEHPAIIMYTGSSYQIWFGQNDREEIANYREMKDYLKGVLFQFGEFNRAEAIKLNRVWIDLDTNKPNGLVRTFFSLHYPPSNKSQKRYTGLAAVPVAHTDIDKFNPMTYAHPETVLANFDVYSSYVAAFYDEIQVGQDYESEDDIESTPSCSRLDVLVPDAVALKALYKEKDLIKVEYKNIGGILEDEEKVYAHPVARGVLAVLVYDPRGTSTPKGMKSTRVRRGTVITEKPHTYYVLSNGTVIYDDYICRDLERLCESKKIKQTVLVGRVSLLDSFNQEEREDYTRNALIRTEGILPHEARRMRFTINRVPVFNSEPVPIEIMGEQVKEFTTKRIVPPMYFEFTKPVGMKLKRKFMDLVRSRMTGSMMVEGEEKYLVKSTRTIYATVIGMDKSGKAFNSNEIPNVYIAVGKKSSRFGVEYITVAKAQIALKKEDRITLRTIVDGIDGRNLIPMPRGSDDAADVVQLVEPSVVVEVTYDDVTPQRMPSFTSAFTEKAYRASSNRFAINHLVNAKVVAIKEDLDHRRVSHVDHRQEELLEPKRTSSRESSLIDALPNPSKIFPEFIARNPSSFFGVPTMLTTYVGGHDNSYTHIDEEGRKITVPNMLGGRAVEVPLIRGSKSLPRYLGEELPPELEKPFNRMATGEEGYAVFIDPESLVKTQDPPNYRITDLGFEYNTAIDDRYGMGQDGNSVTSMATGSGEKPLKVVKSYVDLIDEHHFEKNLKQEMEDSKVIPYTMKAIPGSVDSEDGNRRGYDKQYIAAYKLKDKQLKASSTSVGIDEDVAETLVSNIMSNPRPLKADAWDSRIDLYVEEFNKWDSLPKPKEDWERYAIGMFVSWEVPLLEKERLMREAKEKYELTEEEASIVDTQFAAEVSEDVFQLTLSDLYEVPDDDEEGEESDF